MRKLIFISILLAMLAACSRTPSIKNGHLEKIEASGQTNVSYYSGVVAPIKTVVIPSPTEGVIVNMSFQYGNVVKSKQPLFMISSAKFLSDYKAALMQYIKSKNEFDAGKTQLQEAEFLHKNQLISDDEYKTKKSNYYANQLTLIQAKDALAILLRELDIKNVDLYNLSITDIDKITQAMHLQKNSENIQILSPVDGVVLSAGKTEEDAKKLSSGDAVKQGDVLAVIGDMSGLSVHIKVNELTINQLKIGQKVNVTGIAFPDFVLAGEVKRVDQQGESNSNGLPQFPVEIVVPTLTKDQQAQIHVGMSAQVEINQSDANDISIPISAVKEKSGAMFVEVYDEQKRILKSVAVKTGKTTADKVAVLTGLKLGDQIVVPG